MPQTVPSALRAAPTAAVWASVRPATSDGTFRALPAFSVLPTVLSVLRAASAASAFRVTSKAAEFVCCVRLQSLAVTYVTLRAASVATTSVGTSSTPLSATFVQPTFHTAVVAYLLQPVPSANHLS